MSEMDELEELKKKKLEELKKRYMDGGQNMEKSYPNEPLKITDADFDQNIKKYNTIVIDCWAPWCGPCRMLAPTIDQLAREYDGKVAFGKLNTDQNRGVATNFRIMSIPTLLFIKNGKLVDTIIGAVPKEVIEAKIKKYI